MAPATFQVHSETAAITAELSWPVLAHREETEKEASGAHYTWCGRPHRHPDRRQPLAQAMAAEEEAPALNEPFWPLPKDRKRKDPLCTFLQFLGNQPPWPHTWGGRFVVKGAGVSSKQPGTQQDSQGHGDCR